MVAVDLGSFAWGVSTGEASRYRVTGQLVWSRQRSSRVVLAGAAQIGTWR